MELAYLGKLELVSFLTYRNSMLLVLETKVRNPSYGLPFEVFRYANL